MFEKVSGSLAVSGGVFQGLTTFFLVRLIKNFNLDAFFGCQPGVASEPEAIASPFQRLIRFFELEKNTSEIGMGGSFHLCQGSQSVDLNHIHDLYCNSKKVVDQTAIKLHNILVSTERVRPKGLEFPKASLLTIFPVNELNGATNMLSPTEGALQCAQIFHAIPNRHQTPVSSNFLSPHHSQMLGGGLRSPLPSAPSFFECCDYCDSAAAGEVLTYRGDEEQVESLCEQCWLMGFMTEEAA